MENEKKVEKGSTILPTWQANGLPKISRRKLILGVLPCPQKSWCFDLGD
jgi:hypothetical protein